jgi:hypothetical protein
VRPKIKIISRGLGLSILALLSCSVVLMFQNCNGFSADYSPLYDSSLEMFSCQGISCAPNVAESQIQVGNTTGVLQPPPVGYVQKQGTCDSYTCLDFYGYCDTGGLPGSQFYYQWQSSGTNIGGLISSTGPGCDANGRFRVMVQIPTTGYASGHSYQVQITMNVVDTNGVEQSNPRGTNQQIVTVETAQ